MRSVDGGRWTATFRPGRRARLFGTSFLALWLCVWAAGEAFALGILLASLGVRRISVGGAFAFAGLGAVVEAAREFLGDGTYGFMELARSGGTATRPAFSA